MTGRAAALVFACALLCPKTFGQNVEIGGVLGGNFGTDRVGASGGVDVAGRFYNGLALTGRYIYNKREVHESCLFFSACIGRGSYNVHEAMGGLRASFNRQGLVSPYLSFSAGEAHFTGIKVAAVGGTSAAPVNSSESHFAWSPGGGVFFGVDPRLGLKLDFQYVRPVGANAYSRAGFGVVFRL